MQRRPDHDLERPTMRSRLLAVAALVAFAFALTACSGPAARPAAETSSTADATKTAQGSAQMDSSNPDPATLLTVADVEKVTGLTGLKLVEAGSSSDAVGRLNFATSDGVLVATMNIGDGTAFDQSMQGMYFSELATGTGSMCFVGPSKQVSPVLTIFAAAKGDHAVIMKTFLKKKGGTETWISISDLQTLVGVALGRWG
jgi:hypothetical protein